MTQRINSHQAEWYSDGEKQLVSQYIENYRDLIAEMKSKTQLRILDVGGGAGYFISELKNHLSPTNAYFVVDTYPYINWNNATNNLTFLECDAAELSSCFEKESFDLVFCNMLFHHLLSDSYNSNEKLRFDCLKEILYVLKKDGTICFIDNFCDGLLLDSLPSRLIYTMTSQKNPLLVKLFSAFGSNSAGVGVCMLSEKIWRSMLNKAGYQIITIKKEPDSGLSRIKK